MNNNFSSFSKPFRFEHFSKSVQQCNLCQRAYSSLKVLSDRNGNIDSKIMFIAEAPGRLGAEKTGIPLCGDKTGENFELLLKNIGWNRNDIFITNAILCNPKIESGNNATPNLEEIKNCSFFLMMTINLINPDLIVTLGAVALKALSLIASHEIILSRHVATPQKWGEKTIFPLYHPGPRAIIHRSLTKQRSDFMLLSKYYAQNITKRIKPALIKNEGYLESNFTKLALLIIKSLGRISYFKLTKLLYLIDLYAIDILGESITGELYLRQPEGPWPPALKHFISLTKDKYVKLTYEKKIPFVELIEDGPTFHSDDNIKMSIINDILFKIWFI
jgi:uracil-DNA glycosylase family 4